MSDVATEEELRQWREAIEGMFATQGWGLFQRYLADCQAAISEQWRTCKPEDLRFVQGRFDGLDQARTFDTYLSVLQPTATEETDDNGL